ncbi:MAG: helix-turn-helix domain-containing protein, partial [Clostridia bacterium]|nr:helix-turn-helix domain-containing protein [Clostridia bacterium]
KDLLESTSLSIAGVSSYVVFDDSNYFSALFKKHFGLSPKEYRRRHGTLV